MLTYIGYLALLGLVLAAGGFLLALVETGEAGFNNSFGSWLGTFGLGVIALAVVLGLLAEGLRRLGGRSASRTPPADSDAGES